MPLKADKGQNWCNEEVLLLTSVWSNSIIQFELEGCHRNQHACIYPKMSNELAKHGYERRWEKCRNKIKKLKQEYKEVANNTLKRERRGSRPDFLRIWMLCWVINEQRSLHHCHCVICEAMFCFGE